MGAALSAPSSDSPVPHLAVFCDLQGWSLSTCSCCCFCLDCEGSAAFRMPELDDPPVLGDSACGCALVPDLQLWRSPVRVVGLRQRRGFCPRQLLLLLTGLGFISALRAWVWSSTSCRSAHRAPSCVRVLKFFLFMTAGAALPPARSWLAPLGWGIAG